MNKSKASSCAVYGFIKNSNVHRSQECVICVSQGLAVSLCSNRVKTYDHDLKTGRAKSPQFCIQHFWWLKVQKLSNLLTCILLDYVAHEITKRILKNINLENMTAVFLLLCQNSLRCEISLICCWNDDSRKQKMTLG